MRTNTFLFHFACQFLQLNELLLFRIQFCYGVLDVFIKRIDFDFRRLRISKDRKPQGLLTQLLWKLWNWMRPAKDERSEEDKNKLKQD